MSKRTKILELTAVLLVTTGLWLWSARHNQPSYQGQSVDYWFRQYLKANQSPDIGDVAWKPALECLQLSDQSRTAITAMGTNAVPYLLERAFRTSNNSPVAQKLEIYLATLPDWLRGPRSVSKDEIGADAVNLIYDIRPPLSQVLSSLKTHLAGSNTELHLRALKILSACVGSEKDRIAWLTLDITNADPMICDGAFQLINDPPTHGFSLEMTDLELNRAKMAVSALIDSYRSTKRPWFALYLIKSIGPAAAEAVPFLRGEFSATTNWGQRLDLIETLARVDITQAKTFMPQVLQAFSSESSWADRIRFARTILDFDPTQPTVIDFLQAEWGAETNVMRRSDVWQIFTLVLHTNLPSPAIPLAVLQYQSPAFERWLSIGEAVQSTIQGPSLKQWLCQASDRERQSQGLGLQDWLYGNRPGTWSEAPLPLTAEGEKAVRSIGTNAIPWLLTWVQSTNAVKHMLVKRGFGSLRDAAWCATPALVELVKSDNPGLRSRAYGCLTSLNLGWTNTWSALISVLHHQDKSIRSDAADYLYRNFPEQATQAGLKDFASPWLTQ